MLKFFAILLGAVFLLIGILGFVPQLAPNEYLLGIFHVNAAHNLVHILTGIISIWVGRKSNYASKKFFQIFGLIYLLVAILGFVYGNEPILGFLSNNQADTWLHLVLSIIILYLGFSKFEGKTRRF